MFGVYPAPSELETLKLTPILIMMKELLAN